ncbi:uncharacterized protein LOC121262091 [Juglans microcarpa x Juglans regia]|uniref:uncharacterized protein LOC121262091 n=1 Tax=Juglans microcarpa x Juglans regia TaxID=2249226 RepID=UPI001B7DE31B|nr:uncharacterized protein LOC121262091 [Juglans microcarpa x Juglans regia]
MVDRETEKLSAKIVVNGQVVRDVQENVQEIVLQNFVPTEVPKDVPAALSKGVMVQVMVQNGVLHEEAMSNVQCNEAEGEELRCNGARCSLVLHEMMVSPVELGSPVLTSNLGEIPLVLGTKGYESDVETSHISRTPKELREEVRMPELGSFLNFPHWCSNVVDGDNKRILVSFVYAKCSQVNRRGLWRELAEVQVVEQPWVVVGDFNIIRNDSDRIGGNPQPLASMEEFNDCLDQCGLIDLSSRGNHMSWCNGHEGSSRSWAKLDRTVINNAYTTQFLYAHLEYLKRKTSDHCPMVVHFDRPHSSYGPSPFRFQNMRYSHDGFLAYVEEALNRPDLATGLLKLAIRLKRTKLALRAWNKNTFGKVEDVEADYLVTKIELECWEQREATRPSQIAKKTWLTEGDQNTRFFHSVINKRRKQGFISHIVLPDVSVLETAEAVHQGAANYFHDFLTGGTRVELVDLSPLISAKISEVENEILCMMPSEEEVKDAINSIPKYSSPGPDGFGSAFYIECWDIIKKDVIEAASEFFSGVPLPRFFSSSFIVLIPKVQVPTTFDKFRLISLCSVAYKIFSKILAKRMTRIIHKIVSPEQGAFVPGRSIFENITLAQEMVYSLNKEVLGGNVMVKIDMAKAYDCVDWAFLIEVLKAFGFSSDDLLIFVNGGKRSIKRLVEILSVYEGRLTTRIIKPFVEKVQKKVAGWKFKLLSQGGRLILLRHVLASMPVHILYVINVPLTSIARINSLLSSFFWGQVNGIKKMKWRAWPKLCLPTGEGGLGVKIFNEVQLAFHMKFAFRLMATNSLWTEFFRLKYFKDRHFSLVAGSPRGSRLWRSILSFLPEVYNNVKVIVRGGNASFWYDRWLASGPLAVQVEDIVNSTLRINDCWCNDAWDVDRLLELVGENTT